jgi:hypothetical protein
MSAFWSLGLEHSDPSPDIGAARFSLQFSRRLVLASGVAAAGLVAAQPWPVRSASAPDDRFMALSRLLIPHSLDSEIGRRIAAELKADRGPFSDHIDALLKLAHDRHATVAEDFLPFASDEAKAAALRIISAWYLGVVDDAPDAKIIAYELALMFKPTSDVMTIPTYSISRPNGWGIEAPPLSAVPTF